MTEHSRYNFHPDRETVLYLPEFDTRIVRVEHMATSPDGFELETVRNTPGDTGGRRLDWFFEKDHEQEVKYSHLPHKLDVKFGTRAVLRENNTLKVDLTRALYFQYWDPELARNPDIPKPFGTALWIFTTEEDGSSLSIIQHRGENNFFYGDILGAGTAGMWTAPWIVVEVDGKSLIKVLPIDTDSAKTNIYREAHEETALVPGDFRKLVIASYSKDKVKDHPELTLVGWVNKPAHEIIERSEQARRAGKYRTTHQFAERIVATSGTRDGIADLFRKVQSPFPPTHVAAGVAAWNMLLLEELEAGKITGEQAQREIEQLARDTDDNYALIDDRAAFYYRQHPEELDNIGIRENQPRNAVGYTPAYYPRHQGIAHGIDELVRNYLLVYPRVP